MSEDESVRVQLARIEGKMDLSNARHDSTDAWKVTVDQRLHKHGTDIGSLQAKALVSEARRQGLLTGGKLLWTAITLVVGGSGGLILMKVFGF